MSQEQSKIDISHQQPIKFSLVQKRCMFGCFYGSQMDLKQFIGFSFQGLTF